MKHRFQELVEELGSVLDMPLHIDHLETCTILFQERLEVHLESISNEQMLIATSLCVIPPGKFRENILSAALRANEKLYPEIGSLGYSSKQNQLALFRFVRTRDVNGSQLADILAAFVPTALEWKDSIETQNSAPNQTGPKEGGSFGLPPGIKP